MTPAAVKNSIAVMLPLTIGGLLIPTMCCTTSQDLKASSHPIPTRPSHSTHITNVYSWRDGCTLYVCVAEERRWQLNSCRLHTRGEIEAESHYYQCKQKHNVRNCLHVQNLNTKFGKKTTLFKICIVSLVLKFWTTILKLIYLTSNFGWTNM